MGWNVICDRSGFKVPFHKTRKEWTGLRVRAVDWDPRHPQDLVRAKADRQKVPDARPGAADNLINANDVSRDDL